MSGDTTYQSLERLTHMPDRADPQGDRIAGQYYDNVLFTGGEISGVAISDLTLDNVDIINSTINNSPIGAVTPSTGVFTQVTSTASTGTAPLVISSTTRVANLNVAQAGVADTVTVADAAGDTTTFVLLAGAATGDQAPLTDAGLTYNATTNILTVNISGSATTLSTPRNFSINGSTGLTASAVAFDGSANVSLSLTGTLEVDNGGTGLATYAQGDILYASAATTIARPAKDTNATRYLANTGTSNNPAWAQVNLANGVTGDLPLANIAQFAANTIACNPTASLADLSSVALSASNLIGRGSTGNVAALTLGDQLAFSGTVLNTARAIPIMTAWVAYTPTTNGLGTVSAVNFRSRRVGDTLEVMGSLTTGTVTAAEARVGLGFNGTADNVNIDVPARTMAGDIGVNFNTTSQYKFMAEDGNTYMTIGLLDASRNLSANQNGTLIGNSTTMYTWASVRIDGWGVST